MVFSDSDSSIDDDVPLRTLAAVRGGAAGGRGRGRGGKKAPEIE